MRRFPLLLSLALATACNGRDKDESADSDIVDTDPLFTAECGNGVLEEDEWCDFGEANAANGNCLPTCQLSDTLQFSLSYAGLPVPAFDAEGVTEATAPLGTGAWKPSDENKNLDGVAKFQLNIPLYDFRDDPEFQSADTSAYPELGQVTDRDPIGEIAVSDIADVSFQAWHPAGQPLSYYVYLYTQPDGIDDADSWYGYSLIGASSQAQNIDAPDEQWVTFSTSGSANQIVFRDKRVGSIPLNELATLAELTAGPYTWGGDTDDTDPAAGPFDYGSETVRYVTIATSSGPSTTEFDGLVDAIVITLKDGRSFTIDLEP